MTTPPKPKLFAKLRTDPKKVADGVWVPLPDDGGELLCRRMWCPEHARAFLQAAQDYQDEHGKDSHQTEEGARHVTAVAIASGLVIDWKLTGEQEGRPYDAAEMAGALLDPELADLVPLIHIAAGSRDRFRPDDAAGN